MINKILKEIRYPLFFNDRSEHKDSSILSLYSSRTFQSCRSIFTVDKTNKIESTTNQIFKKSFPSFYNFSIRSKTFVALGALTVSLYYLFQKEKKKQTQQETSEHARIEIKDQPQVNIPWFSDGGGYNDSFSLAQSYEDYKKMCEALNKNNKTFERAQNGKTPVYLFPDYVIKDLRQEKGFSRSINIKKVATILSEQKSTHLVVPQFAFYKSYLIEERLPLPKSDYHAIGLYATYPHLFNEAVKEFVHLFSEGHLYDILSHQRHPMSQLGDGQIVRYDNIPLYLKEEKGAYVGKIGLIDLEHFSPKPDRQGLQLLARIFPYHLELIREEAKQLPKLKVDEIRLREAAEKGKESINAIYLDYVKWLKDNNISSVELVIRPEIQKEVSIHLEKLLQNLHDSMKEHQHIEYSEYSYVAKNQIQSMEFTNDPQQIAKLATQITDLVVSNLKKEISNYQEIILKKRDKNNLSPPDLVELRSVIFRRYEIHKNLEKLLKNKLNIRLIRQSKDANTNYLLPIIAEYIAAQVIEEFANSKQFFDYNLGYYSGCHQICWVRF